MNIYEGMFVLDDKRANENWDGVTKEVRGLLEKHGARLYNLERWDERRLAYRIKGRSRGVYVLTGFLAPGTAIGAAAPVAVKAKKTAVDEKHISAVRAKMRSLAQKNGYPPKIAAAPSKAQ